MYLNWFLVICICCLRGCKVTIFSSIINNFSLIRWKSEERTLTLSFVNKKNNDMISKAKLKYIHSLELKKNRKAEGVFVAEGPKLVEDLIQTFTPLYICATSDWLASHPNIQADEITEEDLKRASFQEHPQQVFAVFRQQVDCIDSFDVVNDELCIALDDVQNPGNLGTIVRLADWFGIEHIFCSQGCADIYNPKVVQSTMGAIARVKVHYCDLPEMIKTLPKGCPVYGTFLDGDDLYSKPLSQHGLIVMGNEGNGVSAEVRELVTERLFIPNYPKGRDTSESLNVAIATAVICAEFRRRG